MEKKACKRLFLKDVVMHEGMGDSYLLRKLYRKSPGWVAHNPTPLKGCFRLFKKVKNIKSSKN